MLKWATEEVDNPDLRDRGFMYWRMLAINPAAAGEIVLAEKPPITTDSDRMDRGALDQLLLHTGTLGSIYHKNPEVSSFLFCITLYSFRRQTFIRNATGKALTDSPALNAHSRAVLIPLAAAQLPPSIVRVPGPGPIESHSAPTDLVATDQPEGEAEAEETTQPGPKTSLIDDEEGEDLGSDQEDEAVATAGKEGRDPYSNLDGAFGNYVADEPKPMGANSRGGRHDDDDLLF